MMIGNDGGPKDLLRDLPYARESISPLVDLARINPALIEPILELAMVIGIRAAALAAERGYALRAIDPHLFRDLSS